MKKTFKKLLLGGSIGVIFTLLPYDLIAKPKLTKFESIPIGQTVPSFEVKDINGIIHSLEKYKGKIIVLEWFNLGCPFVKKHYTQSGNIPKLQKKYTDEGIIWLSVCSNNKNHRDYSNAEELKKLTETEKVASTGVVIDDDGELGKKFGAITTPHFFIINKDGKLAYKGAIDDIRSANPADISKAKNYISSALDALKAGTKIKKPSTKSYGCSVKY